MLNCLVYNNRAQHLSRLHRLTLHKHWENVEWKQQYVWESSEQCVLWSKQFQKESWFYSILHVSQKIWPDKKFCWSLRKKLNEEEANPQPNKTFSQNYQNRQKLPTIYKSNSNDRSNAQKGRSDIPYVAVRNRSRIDSYSGTVGFEAKTDKVNSLFDTLQSINLLN